MKKHWWCQVALGLVALGCSDSGGGSAGNGGSGSISVGGSDGGPSMPGDTPPRARRGEVTLLGSSPSVPTGTWSINGPASGAKDDEATVTCDLTTTPSGATLEVSASSAGPGVPRAELSVYLLGVAPTSKDVSYDEPASSQLLSFYATFPGGYQYEFGADQSVVPAVLSSCSVVITAISETGVTGQVACRNLLASSRSADAPTNGGAVPRASATIAFDCPIVAHSGSDPSPQGGSGGAPGVGGSDPGPYGGAGGMAGTGGVYEPPKSCTGVVASCSSRSEGTCTSVKGCERVGDCSGVSTSCYSQFSSYSCSSQQGCVWSSLNKKCSGSAWSCSLMNGSSSCVSQSGCYWEYNCEGTATSCSALGEFECASQPGCSWK